MIPPTASAPQRPSMAQRYGPLVAIALAIVVVGALVTVSGKPETVKVGGGGAATAEVPLTYAKAKEQGIEKTIDWVENCDPITGKIKMPTAYAPPCVPKFSGDNGGATAPGVTADKITVVFYKAALGGDVLSSLAGNLDEPANVDDTSNNYVAMFNDLAELYGRKVEMHIFQATATGDDPVPFRADATRMIEQYKPFASIGGPALTNAYAEELAANGVLCIGCGISTSDTTYQEQAPYMWGTQASPDEWLQTLTSYLSRRVVGRNAVFAGDADFKKRQRKLGIVHFEQDPPVFGGLEAAGDACESLTGWTAELNEIYFTKNMTERAPLIISKFKEAGITTLIFMGDPVMPIFLTKEATRQGYFPEWILTGTVLTDTRVLARKYDPEQWKNAYGLSQLPAYVPREKRDAWFLHEWYTGSPPKATGTNAIIFSNFIQLFIGLHAAGPKLNPETFGKAMFELPVVGGGPVTPQVSYGPRGIFRFIDAEKCQLGEPRPDFQGYDDMVEIWWDPKVEAVDEQGARGAGVYRYANNGKRYTPESMPTTDIDAFKTDGSVFEFKQPTPEDNVPDYPRPTR